MMDEDDELPAYLQEHDAILRVLDLAQMITEDWCTGFNTTEYGCTCPACAMVAAVKRLNALRPDLNPT